MGLLVAFGTDDEKKLNDDHVGKAKFFLVYRFSNKNYKFLEKRINPKFKENESLIHGDPEKAKSVAGVLKGIDVLVGKKFGPNIVRMKNKFVCVIVREETIQKALEIVSENLDVIDKEKQKGEKRGHLVLKGSG